MKVLAGSSKFNELLAAKNAGWKRLKRRWKEETVKEDLWDIRGCKNK